MIKIFYHVYCGNNHVFKIVEDMITRVHFSNLYGKCDIIYIFMAGKRDIIFQVKSIFENAGSKFKIEIIKPDDETYERLTLENIHKYINEDDKCLYISTKGVTSWCNRNPIFKKCNYEWVYFMTYFLIAKHTECLEKLDLYDTVGTHYSKEPSPHWSGNMWWANGKYLLSLPTKIGPDYYDPEVNFLFLNKPNYYEIKDEYVGYSQYTPKCKYVF